MAEPETPASNQPGSGGMSLPADFMLMAAGVFALATLSGLLRGGLGNVSGLWLANGFAVGMLLTARRQRWQWLLAAAAVGIVSSAFYLGQGGSTARWLQLINVAEIASAAWLLRAWVGKAEDLTRFRPFFQFLAGAVLLAPALMVMLVIAINLVLGRPVAFEPAQRMLLSHMLGMAVMAPVTLALRNDELRVYLRRGTWLESALTLGVVVAVVTVVFLFNTLPLLFLIFLPMMRVAYRGGFAGTAIAVLAVAVIGAFATALGHGPIAAMSQAGRFGLIPLLGDGFLLLQVFVAALLVSMFPLIVALAEGRRAHHATEELQNRLRLLMEHTSDVLLLTDLNGRRLFVSPAIREMLGVAPAQFLRMQWQDYVHEYDQEQVAAQMAQIDRTREPGTIRFRSRRTDGRLVWLEACVKHFRDHALVLMQSERDGEFRPDCGPEGDEGFVVTLRDITARRHAELDLESANAELAALIRTDSLTGLASRRRFDEVLEEAWQRGLADGAPLAVMMIDVDHFKQFNDAYGHQRGDFCLRQVAGAISSGLFHPADVAARYGGEEFAVILFNTSADNAAHAAERIRRAVHDLRRPHMASPLGVVTVSIGVAAAYPVAHGSASAVVQAADEALYTSKSEGCNRTTLLDVAWPAATQD